MFRCDSQPPSEHHVSRATPFHVERVPGQGLAVHASWFQSVAVDSNVISGTDLEQEVGPPSYTIRLSTTGGNEASRRADRSGPHARRFKHRGLHAGTAAAGARSVRSRGP